MPRSPQQMIESISRNLPAKTGRTLEQWLALLERQPFERHGERVRWLMSEHGLTRGYAVAIAWKAGADETSPDELVDRQYGRAKAPLRRQRRAAHHVRLLHERRPVRARPGVHTHARRLGRVLAGHAETDRLRAAGSFGSGRITHRLGLVSPDDVDGELRAWLGEAFGAAARQ